MKSSFFGCFLHILHELGVICTAKKACFGKMGPISVIITSCSGADQTRSTPVSQKLPRSARLTEFLQFVGAQLRAVAFGEVVGGVREDVQALRVGPRAPAAHTLPEHLRNGGHCRYSEQHAN